ncbi:MAG: DUF4492 domain-containing protein [Bacteroidetes bacterium GWF2_33_16]|nr:MAG: DUF4492 domain-containing protein [Bacteroidetes bacterium GWE2_32_14]OFY05153.1 MAG: DUF4492 domain-containing protein [Bacteroidetes bacterium GWF2_33_16]OFY97322.1 MAG: DUF4492 domain-containing protein [Bacteroidetes bacterium RIFOXYC12_FULL_35_7]
MTIQKNIFKQVFLFYYEGFRSMTLGKRLWIIILIKLFIIFVILKLFFFPNLLKSNFATDKERGEYVLEQLTTPKKINND